MKVRSMTGYARIQKSSEAGDVVVSVKSVNHRGLDMHFHMPDELDGCDSALRAVVRRLAARGHFQVQVGFTRTQPVACTLNRGLLEAYLAAYRQAARELKVLAEPDLNSALSLPGMFQTSSEDGPPGEVEQLLVSAMEEAMAAVNAFREREGAELAADMNARAKEVEETGLRLQKLRAKALPAFQSRLAERLGELLGGASLDPQRLAQEAAILADRSDIEEELTRLRVHSGQLSKLLAEGGEVGKKLDFLLQEMGRETNTILSKTVGLGDVGLAMTEAGLAAKAEIEKIREQAQNLE